MGENRKANCDDEQVNAVTVVVGTYLICTEHMAEMYERKVASNILCVHEGGESSL